MYSLKMKASRSFFSEVNQRFPTMPFTLRAGDERNWRMGVVECVKHSLFTEYPVLFDKVQSPSSPPILVRFFTTTSTPRLTATLFLSDVALSRESDTARR